MGKAWFTDTLNGDEVYFESISRDFGLDYHDARKEFWRKPEHYTAYYDDWDGMDPAPREVIDLDTRRVVAFEDPRLANASGFRKFRPDSDESAVSSSDEILSRLDIIKLGPNTPAQLDVLVELRRDGASFGELKNLIAAWRNNTAPVPN